MSSSQKLEVITAMMENMTMRTMNTITMEDIQMKSITMRKRWGITI